MRDSTEVRTYKLYDPPVQATCGAAIPAATCHRWMREYHAWFQRDAPENPSHRVVLAPSASGDLLAKRDELALPRRFLYALLGRPARSLRAFRLGLALTAAAVPTARPLALIERRARRGRWESCLVLERLDAPHLWDFLLAELPQAADRSALMNRLVPALAATISQLHRAGFRQRDLKATNILVGKRPDDELVVSIVDFEGMTQFPAPPSQRVRIRDLARLGVSLRAKALVRAGVERADWESLVAAYWREFEGRPPLPAELAAVLLSTDQWAQRKIRRNRRRRRPIT